MDGCSEMMDRDNYGAGARRPLMSRVIAWTRALCGIEGQSSSDHICCVRSVHAFKETMGKACGQRALWRIGFAIQGKQEECR